MFRNDTLGGARALNHELIADKPGFFKKLLPFIFNADDKKPPKGFEKFFKKKDEKESQVKSGKGNYINFNQI